MSRSREPRPKPFVRSEGDPRLSPEVDLLECLSAEDLPLSQVRLPFSSFATAQRAVEILIRSGCAQIVADEGTVVVPRWQVTRIIQDRDEWSPDSGTAYRLRLTEKGYEQFVDDSKRFLDDLFGTS